MAEQSQQKPTEDVGKRFEFLDRPIVLTLLGGIFLSLITTLWQQTTQRRMLDLQYERGRLDQKFQLLRALPFVYDRSYDLHNHSLQLLLRAAEEKNKSKDQQSIASIQAWYSEADRLQDEISKVEPMGGILTQIEALFTLQLVRTKAKEMREKWYEFVRLRNAAVEKFNPNESLTSKEIQDYESSRKRMADELGELLDDLIRNMGSEISRQPAVSSTVPNKSES